MYVVLWFWLIRLHQYKKIFFSGKYRKNSDHIYRRTLLCILISIQLLYTYVLYTFYYHVYRYIYTTGCDVIDVQTKWPDNIIYRFSSNSRGERHFFRLEIMYTHTDIPHTTHKSISSDGQFIVFRNFYVNVSFYIKYKRFLIGLSNRFFFVYLFVFRYIGRRISILGMCCWQV